MDFAISAELQAYLDELDLATPGVSDHLWATTMAKLAVDQPTYAAYRAELESRVGKTS